MDHGLHPDYSTSKSVFIKSCTDAVIHNRDISPKALRQMRGTDRVNQVKRATASRVAPVVWPAGAWLANGPIQLPAPSPGSRNYC
jgi:3-(3-hydroxy-phenyl)propionate hydroxylase